MSLGLKHMARYVSGLIRDVLTGEAKAVPQPSGGPWPPACTAEPQPCPPSHGGNRTFCPSDSTPFQCSTPMPHPLPCPPCPTSDDTQQPPPLFSVEESSPAAVEAHWLHAIGGLRTVDDHPTAATSAYSYTDGSQLGVEVRKTHVFLCHVMLQLPSFHQDRLGTNMGNALKKRDACFAGEGIPSERLQELLAKIPRQRPGTTHEGWRRRDLASLDRAERYLLRGIYMQTPLRFKLGGRSVPSARLNVETARSERKRPDI
eukprot:COSAG06_NODE_1238_length_10133_cov_3382.190452_8_plen_259_part_00